MITFKKFLEGLQEGDDLEDVARAVAREFNCQIAGRELFGPVYYFRFQLQNVSIRPDVIDDVHIIIRMTADKDKGTGFVLDMDQDFTKANVIRKIKSSMVEAGMAPPTLDRLVDPDVHPELAAKIKARQEKRDKKLSS